MQPAELPHRLLDRGSHCRFVPHVALNKDCSITCGANLLGDGLALGSLHVHQRDGGALAANSRAMPSPMPDAAPLIQAT